MELSNDFCNVSDKMYKKSKKSRKKEKSQNYTTINDIKIEPLELIQEEIEHNKKRKKKNKHKTVTQNDSETDISTHSVTNVVTNETNNLELFENHKKSKRKRKRSQNDIEVGKESNAFNLDVHNFSQLSSNNYEPPKIIKMEVLKDQPTENKILKDTVSKLEKKQWSVNGKNNIIVDDEKNVLNDWLKNIEECLKVESDSDESSNANEQKINIIKKEKKHKKSNKDNISKNDVESDSNDFPQTEHNINENQFLPEDYFEVTNTEKNQLKHLTILTPFKIARLHTIHSACTRPTKEQLEKIREAGLKYKSGPYTKEEDTTIKTNFSNFCKIHNIPDNAGPFLSFGRKASENVGFTSLQKRRFLQNLARGLGDRLTHSVYNRFRLLFLSRSLNSGKFTQNEDEKILNYIENSHSTFLCKDLSKMLNRTVTSVQKRILQLRKSKAEQQTIRWTNSKMFKLVRYLMESVNTNKINELKHKTFTTNDWLYVSKKMENVPIEKIKRVWKYSVYPKLFVENTNLDQIRMNLITILHKKRLDDWRAVKWSEIAEELPGYTGESLYILFRCLCKYNCPQSKYKDMGECIKILYDKMVKGNGLDHLKTCSKLNKLKFV